MRFWLCASLFGGLQLVAAPWPNVMAQEPPGPKQANEITLAGLRPGRDTLAAAEKRYHSAGRAPKTGADTMKEWRDGCEGRGLRLEADSKGVIQSITATSLAAVLPGCKPTSRNPKFYEKAWTTGRGLKLGDAQNRVLELYGEPNSSGPSVKGARELELLFYAFDWAGSDVPQVMEVSCDRATGRVVEITLAFPSL